MLMTLGYMWSFCVIVEPDCCDQEGVQPRVPGLCLCGFMAR